METYYSDWALLALDELKEGKAGAERAFLEAFAFAVLNGDAIEPGLQQLVNAVIAMAIFEKKLPDKAKGRPINSSDYKRHLSVAVDYWELRDQGISYAQAVETVSQRFHMSERHVMRSVSRKKMLKDKEYREKRRDFIERLYEPGGEKLLALLTKVEDDIDNRSSSEIREELELLIRAGLDTALAALGD